MPHFIVKEIVRLVSYVEADTAEAAKALVEARGVSEYDEVDTSAGSPGGTLTVEEYDPEG